MGIIEFYCEKYFSRFGVLPVRIGKEDKFKVGNEEKTLGDIERAVYPKKAMSEEVKEKLKKYNKKKAVVRKRTRVLLKGTET